MKRYSKWLLVLWVAIPFLLFFNNLRGTWILDDHYQVEQNQFIRSFENLPQVLTTRVWQSSSMKSMGSDIYRPVFLASYMTDFFLFGLNPAGFHLSNNLLHCINMLLLFLIAMRFLSTWFAVACAVLFAVHPIVVETVSWIGGRMDLLVTFFSLLMTYLLIHWNSEETKRPKLTLALLLLMVPLGIFSKEVFTLVPFSVLAVLFLADQNKSQKLKKFFLVLVTLTVVTATCILWRQHIVNRSFASLFAWANLQNAAVLLNRFSKLFFQPTRTDFFYPIQEAGLQNQIGVFIFFLWALILSTAIFFSKRKTGVLLGLALFIVPLVPVALVVDILGLVCERYFYLPMAGFSIAVASVVQWIWEKQGVKISKNIQKLSITLFVVWVTLLSTITFARNLDWCDEVTLYQTSIVRKPDSHVPYYYLANHYARTGEKEREIQAYQKLLSLNPNHISSLNNLSVLMVEQSRFVEAKKLLEKLNRLEPNRPKTFYNVGFLFEKMKQPEKAIHWYQQALMIDPHYQLAADAIRRLKN